MSDATPTPPPEPTPQPPRPSRRGLWIMVAAGGVLIALGLWLVFATLPDLLTRTDKAGSTPAGKAAAGDARKIQATLFYVSEDGAGLLPVNREVLYGATPTDQARHIVDAQVHPPPEGYVSAIPAGTKVRGVFLTARGEAYVDLGAEVAGAHSGGSLNEALAVFAVVNALTTNLPGVTAVQILVDGKEVETLAGHVDLRQPLARAQTWVRKAQ